MGATLADLPDLRPRPELDEVLTIRVSARDRQRLEGAARELGVAPSRLARAILRRSLAETETTTG